MTLRAIIDKLTGPKAPRLASPAGDAPIVEVPRLQVHTAEDTVIVTICPDTVEIIREIARSGVSATITDGELDVHFTPVEKRTLTVKDPKKGWVLPLDKDVREKIEEKLKPAEDGYEINQDIAFIVEDLGC
ncbi:hypothetical protein CPHO_08630 [Corynebacterium phocae]|uniref:Uncharacterized protein n=1 Tax=Corynebacterium phocae TaxID=161895 RepID=A0A1L7D6M5_9CORY|nr:hypothetical protein [Corynebacterium phocae]APT93755.1 hypothetical protein CPHO_08630 [Corynebacterium phocae]KAA8723275.1 hypothetical protein F4V58_08135 [Corynebacterium phocae]